MSPADPAPAAPTPAAGRGGKKPSAGQVLVVTSVMFTFISYWRTAAIVLCDLASTAYYIGGVVESQIGKAAPWFILAVMVFSYAVRSVYIESCSMFVRGGVYRVVKEAMGGGMAKLSVSALMFDYILTGPISGVSAGQYIIGLAGDLLRVKFSTTQTEYGSAAIAIAITLYFWRVNVRGLHESSGKALKIMGATTVMGVIILGWCLVTLAARGGFHLPPLAPDLSVKYDAAGVAVPDALGNPLDPLGFIGRTGLGAAMRPGAIRWGSLFGLLGIMVAFGHSILAMSGEETLAQVYREVESPKLKNFKKAAFIVFLYSLLFTSLISFFAVMIIPDDVRMSQYSGNLIGGLAMSVVGPIWARLALNALVVVVGFLILSGAVNTAIVGSNGVLNRVAEDGVLPDSFLKPHPRYGTTYRLLNMVVALQIFTIIASRGKVLTLGEAYAFGVVWSFVFKAVSMLVLRFTEPQHREYEVPGNIKVGKYDVPLGIGLIAVVLAMTAVVNFMTKEVATISGVIFTTVLFIAFYTSERRRGVKHHDVHEHLEQFNESESAAITAEGLGLTKPHRKLVAIRSPRNLSMLERTLAETDPETTDVVVMTANVLPPGSADMTTRMTDQDRELLTAVVNLAELAGKPVRPLIVPTNEPFYALTQTARAIGAQEIIMGGSHRFNAHDQLDQVALYWLNLDKAGGAPAPVTIRVLGPDRDARLDVGGGSQIPALARNVNEDPPTLLELRQSWRGVQRLLLAYDGSALSADFLDTVLSFLDASIAVTLVDVSEPGGSAGGDTSAAKAQEVVERGIARARELGREVESRVVRGEPGPELVRAAVEGKFDAIFMSLRGEYRRHDTQHLASNTRYVLENAPCRVILGFAPKSIPAGQPAIG